jgi:hypothetical protein
MAAYYSRRWKLARDVADEILRVRPEEPSMARFLAVADQFLKKESK